MGKTPIEWVRGRDGSAGFSINPIRFRNRKTGKVGHYCEKISPGCKFCYADAMQTGPYLSGLPFLPESFEKGELFLDRNALLQVMNRRKPTSYFWCDMTDLFGRWVPFEWIDEVFATIVATPHHRHFILTKRDERALEYFASGRHGPRTRNYPEAVGPDRANYHLDDTAELDRRGIVDVGPKPDIWIGVSCEDRARMTRLANLRKMPADHRFVSFEPLLEDLNLTVSNFQGIELAIWGGESGGKARDCFAGWIRNGMIVARKAKTRNFVKQLGRRPCDRNDAGFDGDGSPRSWPAGTRTRAIDSGYQGAPVLIQLKDPKGGDMEEWPPALRVRELWP